MTIRFSPKGYQPTKKERIEQGVSTLERKIGKALDKMNAGKITKDQFINEINVTYSNYKRNQQKIYNE